MNMMRLGLYAMAATVALPSIADARPAGLATTLRQLDAGFVCPQFLPSDEARRVEISTFARTLAVKGVSFAQANQIRASFLTRHNCNASMAADAATVQALPSAVTQITAMTGAAPK